MTANIIKQPDLPPKNHKLSLGFSRFQVIEFMNLIEISVYSFNNANKQRSFATIVSFVFIVCFLSNVRNVSANQTESVIPALTNETYVEIKLSDAMLVDEEGHPTKFASQAVGDRIVAINFIYTTCNTVCPLTSAIFKQLQDKLGKRLGKEFWLISISLDPVTDTPARLKEYAAEYNSETGWAWLTGNASDMEQVLTGLGTTSANFKGHTPLVLVGDAKNNRWVQFNALAGPEQIRAELERLLATRNR